MCILRTAGKLAGIRLGRETSEMGFVKKARNRFRMDLGRARARYGRATGNRSLQAKGRWQRIVNATRQAGEQVRDSGKNIRGGLR
jgi:uncharacterized protein YjbJ (UPF0337 family)